MAFEERTDVDLEDLVESVGSLSALLWCLIFGFVLNAVCVVVLLWRFFTRVAKMFPMVVDSFLPSCGL